MFWSDKIYIIETNESQKIVQRTLKKDHAKIAKHLANNLIKLAAKAICDSEKLFSEIINFVVLKCQKEINDLCGLKKPSGLRDISAEHIRTLNIDKLKFEFSSRMPVMFHLLMKTQQSFC